MNISYCKILFSSFLQKKKRGERKGRDKYFSVGRRGATRSTTADDRAGSSVRVRAQQVTRQCESIEAKKSNAGVCRYTR